MNHRRFSDGIGLDTVNIGKRRLDVCRQLSLERNTGARKNVECRVVEVGLLRAVWLGAPKKRLLLNYLLLFLYCQLHILGHEICIEIETE